LGSAKEKSEQYAARSGEMVNRILMVYEEDHKTCFIPALRESFFLEHYESAATAGEKPME